MSENLIPFGPRSCTDLTIEPFDPICERPDIQPSIPRTFDVPLRLFAPPVPPSECVCFKFDAVQAETAVKRACSGGKSRVDITQEGEDCCAGVYKVTPQIEIPCLPFDIANATVSYGSDKCGPTSFSLGFEKKCTDCTILPTVSLNAPCLPFDIGGVTPAIQSSGCGNPSFSLSFRKDCDSCNITPNVEMAMPCMPFTINAARVTASTSGTTGTANLSFAQDCANCTITPSLTINFPKPPVIPSYCFEVKGDKTDGFELKVKYRSKGGTASASGNGPVSAKATGDKTEVVKFSVGLDTSVKTCTCYKIGSGEINLGDIGGFDNGGDVNLNADNVLEIDGSEAEQQVWYEGGIGDLRQDDPEARVKRGPLYMNGAGPSSYGKAGAVLEVPNVAFTNMQQFLTIDKRVASKWSSSRPDGIAKGFVGGNLDIVAPAGFQWHDRGVAAVMGHWRYNQSGVLSRYEAANGAALLSPAPATLTTKSGEKGASGLRFFPTANDDNRNPGLVVNDGRGLRIHDVTKMKKGYPHAQDTEQTKEGLQNTLEVHRFDPDFSFQKDGRLVLNDLFDTSSMTRRVMTEANNWNRYVRHGGTSTVDGNTTSPKEFAIPVLVPYTSYLEDYYADNDSMNGLDESKIWSYDYDGLDVEQTLSNIIDILTALGVGFVHVSSSGLCLAADNSSAETYTRYADK